jgi:flagellar protein FliO/FliZ
MDFVETIRAIAALGITLGLIGLAAYGARRWGPDWLTRLQPSRADKRLTLVESLPLDASRRLVLVRLDGVEKLILLGDGHLLGAPQIPAKPKPRPKTGATL